MPVIVRRMAYSEYSLSEASRMQIKLCAPAFLVAAIRLVSEDTAIITTFMPGSFCCISAAAIPFGYPEFEGYRPNAPYSKNLYEVDSYRSDMEFYLYDIKEYVDNAENDIERIREAIEEATMEHNDAVDEFNRFARGY